MMTLLRLLAPVAALALAGAASAATFTLNYTTFDDGVNRPISVSATIEADADPYATNGWLVSSITGTRGNQDITSVDDFYNEFYYPATTLPGYSFSTYFDDFGLTYYVGGTGYNLYRSQDDTTFYHEFDGSTGLLILPSAISITPETAAAVPEPASWALMVAGFGLAGVALRRRRMTVALG